MIGGVDVIFRMKLEPAESLERCVRAVMRHWRHAVVQDGETGTVYRRYSDVPFAASTELMIYRDSKAVESWEELGADSSNENTMLHLLSRAAGQVTVVVDDANAGAMPGILVTIRRALQDQSIRVGGHEQLAEAA